MPGSRGGSPPITLPPLKVPTRLGDDEESDEEDGVKVKKEVVDDDDVLMNVDNRKVKSSSRRERIELPGFSEFEAAARGVPLPPPSIPTSAQRMSIDFMR
jgi:zinc finger protein CreA/MIG